MMIGAHRDPFAAENAIDTRILVSRNMSQTKMLRLGSKRRTSRLGHIRPNGLIEESTLINVTRTIVKPGQ